MIIEALRPRSSVLLIDAVADAPYKEQFQPALDELQPRVRERHMREQQQRKWYQIPQSSPSFLAIELNPSDPADFELFKQFAFYSIHAEIWADSEEPIFEADDSGMMVWACLNPDEISRVQAWLEGHGMDLHDALNPWVG